MFVPPFSISLEDLAKKFLAYFNSTADQSLPQNPFNPAIEYLTAAKDRYVQAKYSRHARELLFGTETGHGVDVLIECLTAANKSADYSGAFAGAFKFLETAAWHEESVAAEFISKLLFANQSERDAVRDMLILNDNGQKFVAILRFATTESSAVDAAEEKQTADGNITDAPRPAVLFSPAATTTLPTTLLPASTIMSLTHDWPFSGIAKILSVAAGEATKEQALAKSMGVITEEYQPGDEYNGGYYSEGDDNYVPPKSPILSRPRSRTE